MFATAIAGAIMAVSFSAPPGPVAVETIRRGLAGGFRPALYVQLGSIIGDVTWCALALLGLAPLVQIAWVRGLLGVAGVAVLVYLGLAGLREAFGKQALLTSASATTSHAGAFRSGLAISMANPMAVGYWLSVGGALVAAGVAGTTAAQTSAFMAGFAGGTLAWAFAMALAVRWGKIIVSPVVFRWIKVGCSSALLAFGLSLGAHLFSGLF